MEKTIEQLQKENEELKEKIAKGLQPVGGERAIKLMNTIKGIKQKGRVDTDKMIVKGFADHYNISLWHKDGRRVGPMHPHNAEKTLRRFYDLGIDLQINEPTKEEIEEYKKTDEWKAYQKKCEEKNIRRERSKRGNEAEKIAREIAAALGKPVEQINKLIKSMPLAQGAAMAGIKREPQHIDPEPGHARKHGVEIK